MINFRTPDGWAFPLELNPGMAFSDVATILQDQLDTSEPLEFFYQGTCLAMDRLVGSLDISTEEHITVKVTHSRSTATVPRPRRPLPQRDVVRHSVPPPDFYQRVELLMEIGDFSREDCENALRQSFYNPDRASMYLLGEPQRAPLSPGGSPL
jgi:hypothetical protein